MRTLQEKIRYPVYKIRVVLSSYAEVSRSHQYALLWEVNFYVHPPDLFLLNLNVLVPTWFPVEMAGVILGNLTYRVRRAPPWPGQICYATPTWGPEGRLCCLTLDPAESTMPMLCDVPRR